MGAVVPWQGVSSLLTIGFLLYFRVDSLPVPAPVTRSSDNETG